MILFPKIKIGRGSDDSLATMRAGDLVDQLFDVAIADNEYECLNTLMLRAGLFWDCPCGYTMTKDDAVCFSCDSPRPEEEEELALTTEEIQAAQNYIDQIMADYNARETGNPDTTRICENCGLTLELQDPICWVCWINGEDVGPTPGVEDPELGI